MCIELQKTEEYIYIKKMRILARKKLQADLTVQPTALIGKVFSSM
jgi:hypothetical protein